MSEKTPALFDIRDIMVMLAHRYPFLLIDRVIAYKKGVSLTSIKNVTINEPYFAGHFPDVPTMPGVLILEAMAQSCGVLTARETGIKPNSGVIFYLAGIDNARFKRVVVPGDQITFNVAIDKVKRNLWRFTASAAVDGDLACEANLICVFKEPPGPASADASP